MHLCLLNEGILIPIQNIAYYLTYEVLAKGLWYAIHYEYNELIIKNQIRCNNEITSLMPPKDFKNHISPDNVYLRRSSFNSITRIM